jgi:endonuclease YncB( thermonuclease family)
MSAGMRRSRPGRLLILRLRDHLSPRDLRAEVWVVAKRLSRAAAYSRLTGTVCTSLHALSNGQACCLSMPIEHLLKLFFWSAVISLSATTVTAQTITDGDTLRLNGVTYRLYGVDAPEAKQVCAYGWPAGSLATTRLQVLIGGKSVVCERRFQDRYGRIVAVCRANGEDLGAILVREGLAWAFVRYSRDYVQLEAMAKTDRQGIHAHGCGSAWAWRAGQKSR